MLPCKSKYAALSAINCFFAGPVISKSAAESIIFTAPMNAGRRKREESGGLDYVCIAANRLNAIQASRVFRIKNSATVNVGMLPGIEGGIKVIRQYLLSNRFIDENTGCWLFT